MNRLHKDVRTRLQYSPLCSRRLCSLLTCGIVLVSLAAFGCQTAYYETMEKLGYHKRNLMVSDVKKARDAQQDAKEQFKSALDRFTKNPEYPGRGVTGEVRCPEHRIRAERSQSPIGSRPNRLGGRCL